jgi:hypothetical protein
LQQWIVYKNYRDNTRAADKIRQDRHEREELKRQQSADWVARAQELVEQRAQQRQHTQDAQEERARATLARAKALRAKATEWEARKKRLRAREEAKREQRVAVARSLDARLDESEARQITMQRQEGSRMREHIARDLQQMNSERDGAKRKMAASVREETHQATMRASRRTEHQAAERSRSKRTEEELFRTQRQAFEDDYLRGARANRTAAAATREKARQNREALQQKKARDAARIYRASGGLGTDDDFDSVVASITHRKKLIADKYAQKYVSEEAAREWLGSPLKRLHDAARKAMAGVTGLFV